MPYNFSEDITVPIYYDYIFETSKPPIRRVPITRVFRKKPFEGKVFDTAIKTKDYEPDTMYAVYVDDTNDLHLLSVPYEDLTKVKHPEWIDHGIMVSGVKDCAIEFDGDWKRMPDHSHRFESEEIPVIQYVTTGGSLYHVYEYKFNEPVHLSDNVKEIATVRGWKNVVHADRDQGIIIFYVKDDNKLYHQRYKRYTWGSYGWVPEEEVPSVGVVKSISAFRGNDYRSGVMYNDNGTMNLTMTQRDWAGMGVPPEKVYGPLLQPLYFDKAVFNILSFHDNFHKETVQGPIVATETFNEALDYWITDTVNEIFEVWNEPTPVWDEELEEWYDDWGFVLYVRLKHRVKNISQNDFGLTNVWGGSFGINSVELVDTSNYFLYKLQCDDFNDLDDMGTLIFDCVTGANGYDLLWDYAEKVFYPDNLDPQFVPRPEFVTATSTPDGTELTVEFSLPISQPEGGAFTNGFTLTGMEHRWIQGPDKNGELQPMEVLITNVGYPPPTNQEELEWVGNAHQVGASGGSLSLAINEEGET